ncbi:MAG TPA: hypothetical protein VK669_02830 [Candidatus Limnocylindrales bacterium]|nr:hypothetical protein [Candidatus Limnocylindrales bacterium]
MSLHLTATPTSLDFDGSSKQAFVLHNTGSGDVQVTGITVAGPNGGNFHVKAPSSFTVPKSKNHSVEVDLTLSGDGPARATATVHSNAGTINIALFRSVDAQIDGPKPGQGGSESPSTGPNTDAPSGTGWGAPAGSPSGFSTSPDGGCFVAGTRVLMADGTSRGIEEIGVGDAILAIAERDHAEQQRPSARTARIEHVFRHDGAYALLDVGGIRATPVHRWGVRDGGDEAGFLPTDRLGPDSALRVYDGRSAGWRSAPEPIPAGSARTVYNFATSARTYLVGASADGPWYVVHNDKKTDPNKPNPPNP